MLKIQDLEAPYTLQRWVGILSGTVAAIIAAINAVVLVSAGTPPVRVLFEPAVFFILAISALFFLSAAADRKVLRGIQIFAYVLAAIFTAAGEEPGNLTGFLFAIFAILLYNEYGPAGTRLRSSAVFAVFYIVLSTLLAQRVDWTLGLSVFVFVSGVVSMYGLVVYRQLTIRRKQTETLELRVRERTRDLQAKTDALAKALKQRDTLIHEMHHRIGNGLQLLASYVSLQQSEMDNPVARTILLETETRIQSVAQVHATLHESQQLESLPIGDYVNALAADLHAVYYSQLRIMTDVQTDIDASIDFILPLALIISELVTNAVKHGASSDGVAHVTITIRSHDDRLLVEVSDAGAGFADETKSRIGSEMTDELVRQNEGHITRGNGVGAVVVVSFPLASVSRPGTITELVNE